MKIKFIIGLIVSTVILTSVAVANWTYPQGERFPTGRYEQLYNELMERPEYATTPSPESNPTWVRILQDNSEIISLVFVIGWFISLIVLFNKEKTEPVWSVRRKEPRRLK